MVSKVNKNSYSEQLIYTSNEINFFKNEYKKVLIYNCQFQNKCKLLAKLETLDGTMIEKNSDEIVKVIGQKQFEILFMALCSVINQEFRMKGILSILTNKRNNISDESSKSQHNGKTKVNVQCQTDEIRISTSDVKKRRIRKHLAPYVVQDFKAPEPKIRKLVIDVPNNKLIKQTEQNNELTKSDEHNGSTVLPVLSIHDENSNDTMISTISCISSDTLYDNPFSLIKDVENHTLSVSEKDAITENEHQVSSFNKEKANPLNNSNVMTKVDPLKTAVDNPLTNSNNLLQVSGSETLPLHNYALTFPDGTNISLPLPTKPEDPFHIVTPENLKYIPAQKLIELQMIIDEKLCYHPINDEGNLPIHMATLYNDLPLLKRQCFILNKKNETVDILANNLTALKLSLFQPTVNATAILLQYNADPLYVDDGHASYFHIAAELKTDHLSVLLEFCRNNARQIISENEEIQTPDWESKPDKEISEHLLNHICSMCDNQGYTPLMLASNLGLYENVKLLLEASKKSVNKQMPNTGNTALYIAVSAACNAASGRYNFSKLLDNFKNTIECLLLYGADPAIDNYVGSNVTLLLTEFPMTDLITILSNNSKSKNLLIKNNLLNVDNFQNLMLVKEDKEIKVKNINNKTKTIKKQAGDKANILNQSTSNSLHFRKIAPKITKNQNTRKSNINILQNVVITSSQKAESTKISIPKTESTNSLISIQDPTKIVKPIVISQKSISKSKDNNFIFLSTAKSTNTESIVATQSIKPNIVTKSIPTVKIPQKNMIVIKRSIKKIDLRKEMNE